MSEDSSDLNSFLNGFRQVVSKCHSENENTLKLLSILKNENSIIKNLENGYINQISRFRKIISEQQNEISLLISNKAELKNLREENSSLKKNLTQLNEHFHKEKNKTSEENKQIINELKYQIEIQSSENVLRICELEEDIERMNKERKDEVDGIIISYERKVQMLNMQNQSLEARFFKETSINEQKIAELEKSIIIAEKAKSAFSSYQEKIMNSNNYLGTSEEDKLNNSRTFTKKTNNCNVVKNNLQNEITDNVDISNTNHDFTFNGGMMYNKSDKAKIIEKGFRRELDRVHFDYNQSKNTQKGFPPLDVNQLNHSSLDANVKNVKGKKRKLYTMNDVNDDDQL